MTRLTRLTRTLAAVTLAAAGLARGAVAGPAERDSGETAPARESHIDLAICLDTSGSMSGLINSARAKLWQIVSELATAKPAPRLRVALLTYGTPDYGAESGFVRVNLDFTDNLDRVYQELFALRTNGGTELVARVTKRAVDSLSWSAGRDSYRVIFVAGNESADQDSSLTNEDVCLAAVRREIVVNTIFCGNEGHSDAEGYRRVARLAEGRFASIDQNGGTVTIVTPFDDEIARLGAELNGTYVAYGRRAREKAENQLRQDANAASMGAPVAAERAMAKACPAYRNSSWDLVDAMKRKDFRLEDVSEAELPEEMRSMTPGEREAHLEKMAERRQEIQKRIAELSTRRQAHVKEEMKKRSLSEEDSFDAAVRSAVREQAKRRGFEFAE